jgi:hypothetical protein
MISIQKCGSSNNRFLNLNWGFYLAEGQVLPALPYF